MEKFTNIIAESINELGLFDKNKQYIFTVIKPGFLPYAKQIIEKFEEKGWKVSKTAIKQLLLREANELYKSVEEDYNLVINTISSYFA